MQQLILRILVGIACSSQAVFAADGSKSKLAEPSMEYLIGHASKVNLSDHRKNIQSQSDRLQQLKDQQQIRSIRSCRTC